MVLEMIRLATSPTPIGQTPGFLSRAMRREPRSGARLCGSTYSVHIRKATPAKAWHRSLDAESWLEHSLRHACESRPDGPAEPNIPVATDFIRVVSISLKTTRG